MPLCIALLIATFWNGAFAGLFVYATRAMYERPIPTVNYIPIARALAGGAVDPEENGWSTLEQAVQACRAAEERALATLGEDAFEHTSPRGYEGRVAAAYDFLRMQEEDWHSPEGFRETRALAARCLQEVRATPTIRMLADAWGAERFLAPMEGTSLREVRVPLLSDLHALVKLACAEMRDAYLAGDDARLIESTRAGLVLARALGAQPNTVSYLFAISAYTRITDELRAQSYHRAHAPETAAEIIRMLLAAPVPDSRLAIRVYCLDMLDLFQRVFTNDGAGSGRFVVSAYAADPISKLIEMPPFVRDAECAEVDLLAFLFPPRHVAEAEWARLERGFLGLATMSVQERRDAAFSPERHVESIPLNARFLFEPGGLVPRILSNADQSRLHRAGAILMLAIERHRAERGRDPETLSDLVPAILPALPVDPFSRDGSFGYRRAGDGYVLYSVGWDGVDNGGVDPEEEGIYALLGPFRDAGCDYILNAGDTRYAIPTPGATVE